MGIERMRLMIQAMQAIVVSVIVLSPQSTSAQLQGYTCGSSNTAVTWGGATAVGAATGSTIQSFAIQCSKNPVCKGFAIDKQANNVPSWYTTANSNPPEVALTGRFVMCKREQEFSCGQCDSHESCMAVCGDGCQGTDCYSGTTKMDRLKNPQVVGAA